jgi:hypothetical protein
MELDGKVAVVTGGAVRLGKAQPSTFAQHLPVSWRYVPGVLLSLSQR